MTEQTEQTPEAPEPDDVDVDAPEGTDSVALPPPPGPMVYACRVDQEHVDQGIWDVRWAELARAAGFEPVDDPDDDQRPALAEEPNADGRYLVTGQATPVVPDAEAPTEA